MLVIILITIWLVIYTACIIQLMRYRGYTITDLNKPLLITALKYATTISTILLALAYLSLSGI